MKQISIRELAFQVYQSGDIASTNYLLARAEEGKELHTLRQNEYTDRQIKEYYINDIINYNNEMINLIGYIDGVLEKDFYLEIEEIKSTALDIYSDSFNYKEEHLAQAKLYAYFMIKDSDFNEIKVNLLYMHNKLGGRKNFEFIYNRLELEDFLYLTLERYFTYYNIVVGGYIERIKSIKNLTFPYDTYRNGQTKMIESVRETLRNHNKIMIEAPTGIGKTIGSIYAALDLLTSFDDKLFYLTAKNSGAMAAVKAFKVLMDNGLDCHVLELKSKKKMCVLSTDSPDCDNCPFAKDYFSKVRKILGNILLEHRILSSNLIYNIGYNNKVCPFELSLDLSTSSDVIICDYNYVFDPKVRLKRFFEDNNYRPYILCDEAHNLVNRSIDMYSASFNIIDLKVLFKYLKDYDKAIKIINIIFNYIEKKYACNFINNDIYYQKENDLELETYIFRLCEYMTLILEDMDEKIKEKVIEYYFKLKDYLRISNIYSTNHIFMIKLINNNYEISVKCINAKGFIDNIVKLDTNGIVYFSGTLEPFDYYNNFLSNNEMESLTLSSPFNEKNLLELICPISTKYKDRYYTLKSIIDVIITTINTKKGKYIVFFPSYEYLNLVYENLNIDNYEILVQEKGQLGINNKNILDCFKEEGNILGLFVLGGIYAEGIDFIGDLLDGVIVLGVGLPQINKELDIYKNNLDEAGYKGFDYVYTYPGMTKVIQASGRVIRTETDKGIIVLIDDRYKYQKYKKLFPKHWKNMFEINDNNELSEIISDFYKEN